MTKIIYLFDPQTGEFDEEMEAFWDELGNEYLMPMDCTDRPPPDLLSNEAAVWNGTAWHCVPDYRGKVYWLGDGTEIEITDLGEEPPEGALNEPPPPSAAELLQTERSGMYAWRRGFDLALADRAADAAPEIPAGTAGNLLEAICALESARGQNDPFARLRHGIVQYVRLHPDMVTFKTELGVDDEWMDALFRDAMQKDSF